MPPDAATCSRIACRLFTDPVHVTVLGGGGVSSEAGTVKNHSPAQVGGAGRQDCGKPQSSEGGVLASRTVTRTDLAKRQPLIFQHKITDTKEEGNHPTLNSRK